METESPYFLPSEIARLVLGKMPISIFFSYDGFMSNYLLAEVDKLNSFKGTSIVYVIRYIKKNDKQIKLCMLKEK